MSKSMTSEQPVADQELIQGMLLGHRQAFEQLYKLHYPPVRTMILRNSGSEEEAKDIFQEAVCVLYDKVNSEEGFTLSSQLNTYLYAVSRHLWLKELKRNQHVQTDSEAELEDEVALELDLALHLEKEKQFERMQTSLDHLGEPCRSLLMDFYLEDLSMEEIRIKHGYTNTDSAKNQKYKCLQRLKKIYFGTRK